MHNVNDVQTNTESLAYARRLNMKGLPLKMRFMASGV